MFNEYEQMNCGECKKQFEYHHDSLVIARGGVFCPYCGKLNEVKPIDIVLEQSKITTKKDYVLESRTPVKEVLSEQNHDVRLNNEESKEEPNITHNDLDKQEIEEIQETEEIQEYKDEKTNEIVNEIEPQNISFLKPLEKHNNVLTPKNTNSPEKISLDSFKATLNLGTAPKTIHGTITPELLDRIEKAKEKVPPIEELVCTPKNVISIDIERKLTIGELIDKIHKMCISLHELDETYSLVRHFKGNWYKILDIVTLEDGEQGVIYQALYNDYRIYLRPLTMFLETTDVEKYPYINQYYRFMTFNEIIIEESLDIEILKEDILDVELMEQHYLNEQKEDIIIQYIVEHTETGQKLLVVKNDKDEIKVIDQF